MDKVTVIQADREAAASLFGTTPWSYAQFTNGKRDDTDKVQAFAKHRLATPAPDSEKLREEVKRMEQYSVHVGYDNRGDFVWEDCVSRTEVLAAIGASL